jgi:hypothetical protein
LPTDRPEQDISWRPSVDKSRLFLVAAKNF